MADQSLALGFITSHVSSVDGERMSVLRQLDGLFIFLLKLAELSRAAVRSTEARGEPLLFRLIVNACRRSFGVETAY